MRKFITVVILAVGLTVAGKAQDGYRISGKMSGVPNGTLLLMSDESGKPEIIDSTKLTNGAFEFTGKLRNPKAVYITTKDQQRYIPLILENTHFMINAGEVVVMIQGGEQQDIFNEFTKLNAVLLQEQHRITTAYHQAEQKNARSEMNALVEQLNQALENAKQQEKDMLKKYADTYAAAYVVASTMHQIPLDQIKERYEILGDPAKNSAPGRSVAALIEALGKLNVGHIAPDFTGTAVRGETFTLQGVEAKAKLIHFWESTNQESQKFNLKLLDLNQRFFQKGFEIISISRDQNKQGWIKAMNESAMMWRNAFDPNSEIFRQYHVIDIPHTLLLNSENRIVAINLNGKELQKKIAEMVKKK